MNTAETHLIPEWLQSYYQKTEDGQHFYYIPGRSLTMEESLSLTLFSYSVTPDQDCITRQLYGSIVRIAVDKTLSELMGYNMPMALKSWKKHRRG